MSQKARPLPTPVCHLSLEFYIQYLAWGLGGGEGGREAQGSVHPGFWAHSLEGTGRCIQGIKISDRYMATEVRGKQRER